MGKWLRIEERTLSVVKVNDEYEMCASDKNDLVIKAKEVKTIKRGF